MLKVGENKEMFKVPANLFKGWEGVGGFLIITKDKVKFSPHKLNFQTDHVEIKISEIEEVGKRNTLKLVPNGFYIKVSDGEEYKFVVYGRIAIIEYLNKQIKR